MRNEEAPVSTSLGDDTLRFFMINEGIFKKEEICSDFLASKNDSALVSDIAKRQRMTTTMTIRPNITYYCNDFSWQKLNAFYSYVQVKFTKV